MSRLIDLTKHLGPLTLMRVGSLQLARRILASDAKISFSQNGEDLILDALLGHRRSGFYVDVGCNHPTNISNSYRFYLRGWSGIAIDANAEFGSGWMRTRARDKFIAACVSDEPREVEFKIFESRALSSIDGQKFYDNDQHYKLVRVDRLQTKTLTELLDECHAPSEFAFLSVDVEGHDFEVIRSLEFDRYSPEVVLVELNGTDIDVGEAGHSPIANYLARYSYRPHAVLWSNVFFRRAT
jgi:FkbM family methyltransferase